MDMNTDVFADTVYGKIALKKLAPNEPHFRLFEAGWLGDGKPGKREVMEVKGADFREAVRGPNKGQLSIMVPQTTRSVFVTAREMNEFEAAEKTSNELA